MAQPDLLLNKFENNIAGSYGNKWATEIAELHSSVSRIIINDYANTYPLSTTVRIADFYGQVVDSREDVVVTASVGKAHCSFNSMSASVTGDLVAVSNNGLAAFRRLGATCVPGGKILHYN